MGYYLVQKRWRLAGLVVLAAVVHVGLTGAWTLRNQAKFWVPTFTTISQQNLWEYIGASVAAQAHGKGWGEPRDGRPAIDGEVPDAGDPHDAGVLRRRSAVL